MSMVVPVGSEDPVRRHFRGRFRQHQWRERHLQSSLFTPDSSLLSNHAALKPEGAIICTSNSGYEPPGYEPPMRCCPAPFGFRVQEFLPGYPVPTSTHPEPGKETTCCANTYEIAQPFSCH